jgi:hypothetical protein
MKREREIVDFGLEMQGTTPLSLTEFVDRLEKLIDGPVKRTKTFPYAGKKKIHLWEFGNGTIVALSLKGKFISFRKHSCTFNYLNRKYAEKS